jgi:hypothetical protein
MSLTASSDRGLITHLKGIGELDVMYVNGLSSPTKMHFIPYEVAPVFVRRLDHLAILSYFLRDVKQR